MVRFGGEDKMVKRKITDERQEINEREVGVRENYIAKIRTITSNHKFIVRSHIG